MKRIFAVGMLLVSVMAFTNCGSSNNVCEEAAQIILDGMKEGCKQQTGCCYCTCLLQGKMQDMTKPEQCVCIPVSGGGNGGGECTGEEKQEAQDCVNNRAACKQSGVQAAAAICGIS